MISVTSKDGVLVVELNRESVRNAFNAELIEKITQTFNTIPDDTRLVRLSGKGSSFCAGADLSWMKSMAEFTVQENKEDSLKLFEMFQSIWDCPVPVLSYVHGHAFGGALGLLAVSDVVAVESETVLSFSEVKIGLVPAVISQFVRQKMAPHQQMRYLLSGERFGAKEASAMGLSHFSGSEQDCQAFLAGVEKNILGSGPEAVRATKKLLRDLPGSTDPKALTTSVIAEARVSPEGQEGLGAFFEKRKPSWLNNK